MKNFKELEIWQKGFEIAVETYKLTNTFPSSEKVGISSQFTRAAVSPSNVVEGSSRRSDKDYHRSIEISLGSSFEFRNSAINCKSS
jgi:four helix bundle protein